MERFDLEAFKRWGRQVNHGNDEIVEGAIAEIEQLREQNRLLAMDKIDLRGRLAAFDREGEDT